MMSRRWISERKQEHFYRKAKRMHYRSRAAFKLIQIDQRFQALRPGDAVVDLGASPGGWAQVAKDAVGESGKVIGVDLAHCRPLEGVEFIRGDINSPETIQELLSRFGGRADVVISDMAPNISGNYPTDHARSVHLGQCVLGVCDRILREGGRMVMKVFMGDLFNELMEDVRSRFPQVSVHTPEATRKESSEVYVIGEGYIAHEPPPLPPPPEGPEPMFRKRGNLI